MQNGNKMAERPQKVALLPELDMYELTFAGGKTKRVAVLRTKGKKHLVNGIHDGTFQHEVTFSDGTVQKHVVSTEELVIPDYPALQPG